MGAVGKKNEQRKVDLHPGKTEVAGCTFTLTHVSFEVAFS